MHRQIEPHLKDPIAALDYTMSLMEQRFPEKKVWSDESIAAVKAQVENLPSERKKYSRVMDYAIGVLVCSVPRNQENIFRSFLEIAAVSDPKEVLDHLIHFHLNPFLQ